MRFARVAVPLALAAVIGVLSAGPASPQAAPAAAPSAPTGLTPGDTVPSFDAEALDGSIRHVSFPKGSATVLLFFLSSCPHCHEQIPDWNRAFDKRSKNLTVVGVMLDKESPGFFQLTPIAFPVVRPPKDPDFRKAFKINRVPMTVRVGADGKVEDAVTGKVDPIRIGQLFHP